MTTNNDNNNNRISIDGPPIYDELVDPKAKIQGMMSPIWVDWMATFVQTLSAYLSQDGIFLPALTTTERGQLRSPQEGQMIYNSTTLAPQIWQNGAWKTFTTT